VRLHVVETGNPRGRPILFVHGNSQSWLTWRRQIASDLANDYRLVALDLRGHGQSDKPREGYAGMTERATGTERFERVVLGSLSKVTCPRNWTAVDVTRMRGRSVSMSRLRKPAASPQRSPA
jgi:pimeloyl-ACP methyl ester carboxylesterase